MQILMTTPDAEGHLEPPPGPASAPWPHYTGDRHHHMTSSHTWSTITPRPQDDVPRDFVWWTQELVQGGL